MPRDEAGNRAAVRRKLVACKLLEPSGNPLRVCCWELGALQGPDPTLLRGEQGQRHHGLCHIHTKYPKKLPLTSISSGHGFSSGPRAPREPPTPRLCFLLLGYGCTSGSANLLPEGSGTQGFQGKPSVCGWGLMEFFLLRWRCRAPVCLCSDLREHTEGGVPTAMLGAG